MLSGSYKKDGLRVGGWRVGGFMRIMPLCGSILQAETCQILRLDENPTWSLVWQKCIFKGNSQTFSKADILTVIFLN